ncbi:hypothetical protein V8J82_15785 [Gymnodinialimonas sp. 2305UL16-5]|uniref:hypothetical protein n=1 Tax=Gymnodinialimonas mytili TaxID=3126503 RepID=UPI003095BC30
MSIQISSPRRSAPHHPLRAPWRHWWLRAVKAQQMRHLADITRDPHMARDLGLPPRPKPATGLELLGGLR